MPLLSCRVDYRMSRRTVFCLLFLCIPSLWAHLTTTTIPQSPPLTLPINTIAIFGGSGKLGSECVYQALQKKHTQVVVLARNESKITIPEGSGGINAGKRILNKKLKVIQGTVLNQHDVDRVFDGNNIQSVIIGEFVLILFPFPHSSPFLLPL